MVAHVPAGHASTSALSHAPPPPVPDCLRCPRMESGYYGVYRTNGGRWRARPRKHRNLPGTFLRAEDAARAVASYWERWYGPDWERRFKKRDSNVIFPLPHPGEPGCLRVIAFVAGSSQEICDRRGNPLRFADKQAARKYVRDVWAYERFGLLAPAAFWRNAPLPDGRYVAAPLRRPGTDRPRDPGTGKFARPSSAVPPLPGLG